MLKPEERPLSQKIAKPVISLTPVAIKKVRELLMKENDPRLGLRIFVAGGGCSGLQYGMVLDEEQLDDTIIIVDRAGKHREADKEQRDSTRDLTSSQIFQEAPSDPPPYTPSDELPPPYTPIAPPGDFKVFIDNMSLRYVIGSEVDYVDSLMGAGFTVNNPNAVSSCGCGHSFKTVDGGGEARGCGCGH